LHCLTEFRSIGCRFCGLSTLLALDIAARRIDYRSSKAKELILFSIIRNLIKPWIVIAPLGDQALQHLDTEERNLLQRDVLVTRWEAANVLQVNQLRDVIDRKYDSAVFQEEMLILLGEHAPDLIVKCNSCGMQLNTKRYFKSSTSIFGNNRFRCGRCGSYDVILTDIVYYIYKCSSCASIFSIGQNAAKRQLELLRCPKCLGTSIRKNSLTLK
jgi:DNA-directed RNA polymerase subunit RPC12/RpoP